MDMPLPFFSYDSLDRYIMFRGGLSGAAASNEKPATAEQLKAQARAKRQRQKSPVATNRAVHLFSLEEILALATDITSGLAFLHSHNMLHLDLKAENILLHRSDDEVLM